MAGKIGGSIGAGLFRNCMRGLGGIGAVNKAVPIFKYGGIWKSARIQNGMNRFLLIKELRSSGWRQWKNWGESSTLYQVALGMAGVVSVVCGFRARRSRAKDFYLAWAAVAVGLLTIVIGSVLVPNSVPPKTVRTLTSCINELRQIDGAKEQWVLENKKAVADTPTWPDLVGKHKYIKVMPECPGGGAYTINRMMA